LKNDTNAPVSDHTELLKHNPAPHQQQIAMRYKQGKLLIV